MTSLLKSHRSPRRKSPSRKTRSPRRKSPSRKTRSPQRKSPSRKTMSPRRKLPVKKTRSPRRKSPTKKTRSPKRKSSLKKTRSPKRKSSLKNSNYTRRKRILKGGERQYVEENTLQLLNPKIQEPNVYYMASHGCDTNELLYVPEGCVYVTLGICGKLVWDTKNQEEFIKMFDENSKILNDPVANIEQLQKIFGTQLHIHYAKAKDYRMRKYVNSSFSCFLNRTLKKDSFFAKKSGLYSIGTYTTANFYKLNDIITDKDIDYLYKNSLYPTIDQIKNIYTLTNLNYQDFSSHIQTIFNIDQKTLFHYFPGIYYNFSCRSDCNDSTGDNPSTFHIARRQDSFKGNEVERLSFYKSIDNSSSIHYYLSINDLEKAKELIDNGYDLNEKDYQGNSLLYICCRKGYLELAKLLIEKGVLLDKDGYQECLRRKELFEYMVSAYASEINKHLTDSRS